MEIQINDKEIEMIIEKFEENFCVDTGEGKIVGAFDVQGEIMAYKFDHTIKPFLEEKLKELLTPQ